MDYSHYATQIQNLTAAYKVSYTVILIGMLIRKVVHSSHL